MSKLPGILGMSSYSAVAFALYSPVIVSVPTYRSLSMIDDGGELPYNKLFISLNDPSNSKSRQSVKDTVCARLNEDSQMLL